MGKTARMVTPRSGVLRTPEACRRSVQLVSSTGDRRSCLSAPRRVLASRRSRRAARLGRIGRRGGGGGANASATRAHSRSAARSWLGASERFVLDGDAHWASLQAEGPHEPGGNFGIQILRAVGVEGQFGARRGLVAVLTARPAGPAGRPLCAAQQVCGDLVGVHRLRVPSRVSPTTKTIWNGIVGTPQDPERVVRPLLLYPSCA